MGDMTLPWIWTYSTSSREKSKRNINVENIFRDAENMWRPIIHHTVNSLNVTFSNSRETGRICNWLLIKIQYNVILITDGSRVIELNTKQKVGSITMTMDRYRKILHRQRATMHWHKKHETQHSTTSVACAIWELTLSRWSTVDLVIYWIPSGTV